MGPMGPKGPTGPTGTAGLKGLPGAKGDTGSIGPIGPIGIPGLSGIKGDQGIKGNRGQKGNIGLKGNKGCKGSSPEVENHGVAYERWGNSTCPIGAQLLYSGRAGSANPRHQGGGANYVCMPDNPEYTLRYIPGVQGNSQIYGVEYESTLAGSNQYNAPCAVCLASPKSTVIMIPTRSSCPGGWTVEYNGYLMSEKYEINNLYGRTEYVCVDSGMEVVPGSERSEDVGHFYHVEAQCIGLSCPPYNRERELECVVCSK